MIITESRVVPGEGEWPAGCDTHIASLDSVEATNSPQRRKIRASHKQMADSDHAAPTAGRTPWCRCRLSSREKSDREK